MARHIHADLIHQWAEGAEIETLYGDGWDRIDAPQWFLYKKYRLAKPELYQHKLARMASQRSTEYFAVAQSDSDVFSIEANPDFIEWVK